MLKYEQAREALARYPGPNHLPNLFGGSAMAVFESSTNPMHRERAQALGLQRFFPLTPCRYGNRDWTNTQYGFCYCEDCKAYRRGQTNKSAAKRRERELSERVHACAHCGSEFTGRKRKFCGDECARVAKNKKDSERKAMARGETRKRPYKPSRRPNPIINGTRVCLDCNKALPISEYAVKADPRCNSGQTIRGVCNSCERVDANNRAKKRTPEQRIAERRRAAKRKGRAYTPGGSTAQRTPFHVLQSRAAKENAKQAWRWWLTQAPDDWAAAYYEALGRPWSNPRLTEAEKYRIRYAIDPSFAIQERLRRQVNKAAKRDGVSELLRGALRRGGQSPMAERLLGYSIDDLRLHLERQFTKGMDWPRFMAGEIHIDHIIPQSQFDMRDENQWRKCWCLSNLQPLWARDNLRKRDRVLTLL